MYRQRNQLEYCVLLHGFVRTAAQLYKIKAIKGSGVAKELRYFT